MTVATPPTTQKLLESLTASLASAEASLPEASSVIPPKDGISLLDVKNDLFISYLQHLVFLILLKLRKKKRSTQATHGQDLAESSEAEGHKRKDQDEDGVQQEDVVKALIQCRVYLEKGVKPLEGRLKYQLDKVLRAADDEARNAAAKPNQGDRNGQRHKNNQTLHDDKGESNDGRSEDDASDETDDEDGPARRDTTQIDELSYRPNPAAFLRSSRDQGAARSGSTTKTQLKSGVYRPPRITPVVPPTDMNPGDARQKGPRRPRKSAVLDEYVATELSTAPFAEPSIGSTVVAGGRRNKTARERQQEEERREYEESHFVRLPKESRKERAAAARQNTRQGYGDDDGIAGGAAGGSGGGGVRGGYGGEEWRGLGEGVDRIERLTSGKRKSSGQALLERSRKRELDLGHDGGAGARDASQFKPGERFEKRRKTFGKRNRTKADYEH